MDYYLGEIRLFAGNYVPNNFVACNGSLLSINDNQALFSLLGTTWGGDGVSTFGIPDLRGRVPMGQGQGTGLTKRVLAQTGGAEQVTLTIGQIPPHTHSLNASLNPATSTAPTNNVLAVIPGGSALYYDTATSGGTTNANFGPNAIGSAGSSVGHDNMQPYQALTYMMCTVGIYPTRT